MTVTGKTMPTQPTVVGSDQNQERVDQKCGLQPIYPLVMIDIAVEHHHL